MSTSLIKRKENTAAVLLEAIPGALLQTFGIGHLAQGRIGMGLFIMLSYWALQAVNGALMLIGIGWVTAPLTWLFYMIAAPMNAADWDGERR